MQAQGKALKIAVIGAGMGGLAAASLLARDGHRVTLIERFESPRPLGSGLMVQPVGLAVLDELGQGDAARALGAPIRRMRGWSAQGLDGTATGLTGAFHEALQGRDALDVHYPPQEPAFAMLRASLFHVLWQAMQASDLQLITGETVVRALPYGGGRVLHSEHGEIGAFDLVVDASGAGSALSPLRARALHYGAIWAHVPWPEASDMSQDQLRQRYFRASRMAGLMPIGSLPGESQRRAAVFWSMSRPELEQWGEDRFDAWKASASTFWPQMQPFLAGLTSASQMTPAFYSHGTLRRPYAPGLVFIGDAAHRASPQLGQGANMALLDALALREALRGPPDEALTAYARMRRWHVRLYQLFSAFLTPAYQSDSRILPLIRDFGLAPISLVPPVPWLLTRLVAGRLIPPLASKRWP
ncbi:FAD-dependent monooxygenase [Xinfangfangia sp. D13-10-4-6]|uniref:FAD-dependent oxidoreductase n=1 Tax=Pseudogemmobacter hezensis TaxID=2737662 RepID=UPI001556646D|nr:NAD(P)/FAD-dependent oxidoreductase [Pseudogemmobacter hezensis]NPD15471.1 FAD-dependent monooxygenase [Pseudogemmobacter hezensis]